MTKKLTITLGSIHRHMVELVTENNPSTFNWWNLIKPTNRGAIARRVLFWFLMGEFEIKNGFLRFGRNYH